MGKNVVMSYDEFLLEKKTNQELSNSTPSGSKISNSVNDNMAKLPEKKGSTPNKRTDSNMAKMPEKKGSIPKKRVNQGTTTLPTKKGSALTKVINQNTADLPKGGSSLSKTVDPKMAKMLIGKVTPNAAVNKAYTGMKNKK